MLVTGSTQLIIVDHPDYTEPQWPVTIYDLPRYFPNVMFGTQQEEEALAPFGIFPIDPGSRPEADVVTLITPILVEGKWVQQYESRPFNEDELARNLESARMNALNMLDNVLDNTYGRGFTYTHNGNVENYSMTSDMRQLFTGMYLLAVQETELTRKFKLRTLDNKTVEYTVDEMKDIGKAVMEYVTAVLEELWAIMDQITTATKIEDIPNVPPYIEIAS